MSVGFRCLKLRFLRRYLIENFLLIQLRQNLATSNVGIDIGIQPRHNTAGFGFHLDLGDGLNFASRHDRPGDVPNLNLREL